ncbi:Hypothetical predicted protein [Podarcis lilfordi]|uniref:Uncharacterized protein n=1 Tax=Podarcis lilfordi TaxID=74358 RepID=A0AA35PTP8_9SAUR|nr:Hypothetical predicted protein [Podarcis lilfordi]
MIPFLFPAELLCGVIRENDIRSPQVRLQTYELRAFADDVVLFMENLMKNVVKD